jgi:hypothetical protein
MGIVVEERWLLFAGRTNHYCAKQHKYGDYAPRCNSYLGNVSESDRWSTPDPAQSLCTKCHAAAKRSFLKRHPHQHYVPDFICGTEYQDSYEFSYG